MVKVHTGRVAEPQFSPNEHVFSDRQATDAISVSNNGFMKGEFEIMLDTETPPEDVGLYPSKEVHLVIGQEVDVY